MLEEQQTSWAFGGWSWAQSNLDVVDHEPVESFVSRPASFGRHVVDQPGLPGYLIPVSSFASPCPQPSPELDVTKNPPVWLSKPNTGCSPLCIDPDTTKPQDNPALYSTTSTAARSPMSENWIALVQRGECQFASKVRTMQQLGAKAVVVGGWEVEDGARDELVNMFSPDNSSDITIPSTFVTYASYRRLITLISTSNTTTSGLQTISVILRAEESWGWFSPIITFLLLLLLPSCLTFLTLLLHRFRQVRQERLDRAPEDVVSHLPARIWTGHGWEKEGEWLRKLKIRGQRAQLQQQIEQAKDSETGIIKRINVDEDGPSQEAADCDLVPPVSLNTDDLEAGAGRSLPFRVPHLSQDSGRDRSRSSDLDDIPATHQAWFGGQSECSICLSQYVEGDKVRILPCGHLFHVEEVDPWLIQRKKTCPICKCDVTVPYHSPPVSPGAVLTTTAAHSPSNDPGSARWSVLGFGIPSWVAGQRVRSEQGPSERTPLLPERSHM